MMSFCNNIESTIQKEFETTFIKTHFIGHFVSNWNWSTKTLGNMFRQFVTVETFYIALLMRICITEISDWVPRDSLCDSNFAIAVCTCYMQIPGSLGLWREFRLHALSYVFSFCNLFSLAFSKWYPLQSVVRRHFRITSATHCPALLRWTRQKFDGFGTQNSLNIWPNWTRNRWLSKKDSTFLQCINHNLYK